MRADPGGDPLSDLSDMPDDETLRARYPEVERFAVLMRQELWANREKGDQPGWRATPLKSLVSEVFWHAAKLAMAVKKDDVMAIVEHAADTANMSMMVVDAAVIWPAVEARQQERSGGERSCGRCDQESRGLLVTLSEHHRSCPRRRTETPIQERLPDLPLALVHAERVAARGADPTHGRIDRDIQEAVEEMKPSSLGQRAAIENTLQERRDDLPPAYLTADQVARRNARMAARGVCPTCGSDPSQEHRECLGDAACSSQGMPGNLMSHSVRCAKHSARYVLARCGSKGRRYRADHVCKCTLKVDHPTDSPEPHMCLLCGASWA